jgi:hypothetical protein
MIITEPAPDLAGPTRRPVTSLEQDARRRVQVAAVEKLHLTVNDRTLCGLVTVDRLDLYSDEAGLRAWNTGPLEQCARCAAALLARIRPSERTHPRASDRRTGHVEHPEPAQPDQPIHEQTA